MTTHELAAHAEYVDEMLISISECGHELSPLWAEMQKYIGEWNTHQGFTPKANFATALMLVVTELAEACEAERKSLISEVLPGKTEAEEEWADAIIRLFDIGYEFNFEFSSVLQKLKYNLCRPHKHGKVY